MDGLQVDTIAAISTAPGASAIAVVRLSGPRAGEILERIAPDLGPMPPRQTRLGTIRDPRTGEALDRALVTLHRGPASYTGEDVVEISGHGGWLGPALVLEACVAAGARPAEPGEFTRRAYLNGRMDLVQAEAVSDLVTGRSSAARRAALHQLDRGLSGRIAQLREALIGLEALLATAPEGELLREGALAVLAGRPNSGKSSLFNALLGQERAIVTEQPGTTRDALEANVALGGFPFRLVDTAGLRDSSDQVEQLGIEFARRYLAAADLVVFCVEAGRDLSAEERAFLDEWRERQILVVRTKADLDSGPRRTRASAAVGSAAARVSALTGEGLDQLRRTLAMLAFRGLACADPDAPVLTHGRQSAALREAVSELEAFAAALHRGVGPEVASAHLRPAETALEEMLGVISGEDVLDRVFAEFCIGK